MMIGKTIKNMSLKFNVQTKVFALYDSIRCPSLGILLLAVTVLQSHSLRAQDTSVSAPKAKAQSTAISNQQLSDDNGEDNNEDDEAETIPAKDVAQEAESSDNIDDIVVDEENPMEASDTSVVNSNKETENSENNSVETQEPELAESAMESQDPPPAVETIETKIENMEEANLVEVIPYQKTVELLPMKTYSAYRDRRTTHGFLFNLNVENLYFQDYTSILDEKQYEEIFGQEDLSLAQVSVNYKLNFALGSLVAGLSYGQGTLIDDRTLDERSLTIEKKSLQAQWMLDSIMKEPYFVPYVGLNYWQMGLSEENVTQAITNSYDTDFGTSVTVGFLIQLNWLEPEVSKLAYLNNGLENTYLDVFWTQYQNTADEIDPLFENDFNFGAGLRLEF